MIKSYKIRIYPTKQQEKLIWKHIGCCRFIYNYFLAENIKNYEAGNKYSGHFGMIRELTDIKKDKDFLSEVSNSSLQIVLGDLNDAYQNFFRRVKKKQNPGFPKFKSKKHSKSKYPICANRMYFEKNMVQIQKLGKVKYKTDFDLPEGKNVKFINPRLEYIKATNKYMLSFGLEVENQNLELNDYSVGIDLGVKELAVISYDGNSEVYHNINKSSKMRKLEQRKKSLQRSISRKYDQNRIGKKFIKTKNIEKQELELLKIYTKQKNIRDNYIHQITSSIIKLKPKRVVMENINVSGLLKNKHLSKSIQEQNFFKFITYMKYKCEFNGIDFIQADRFYPSSKTCSCCGTYHKDIVNSLRVRSWTCPDCGTFHDRDVNAARNLENYLINY